MWSVISRLRLALVLHHKKYCARGSEWRVALPSHIFSLVAFCIYFLLIFLVGWLVGFLVQFILKLNTNMKILISNDVKGKRFV